MGAGPSRKLNGVTPYLPEEFTAPEVDLLRRYFTNVDGPVFALVNLPELVKGALMSRYSRSPKSLRRLFLDEFVGDLDVSGDDGVDATVGIGRAEAFYDRFGWWAVVAARWIPWVRTFTPILAGTSRMGYPRFLSANVSPKRRPQTR